jgi:hypothetical protein
MREENRGDKENHKEISAGKRTITIIIIIIIITVYGHYRPFS